MVRFQLDNGRFPNMNLNRSLRKYRNGMTRGNMPDVMTQEKARRIYQVCHFMNSPIEIQPALKQNNAPDGSRRPFI